MHWLPSLTKLSVLILAHGLIRRCNWLQEAAFFFMPVFQFLVDMKVGDEAAMGCVAFDLTHSIADPRKMRAQHLVEFSTFTDLNSQQTYIEWETQYIKWKRENKCCSHGNTPCQWLLGFPNSHLTASVKKKNQILPFYVCLNAPGLSGLEADASEYWEKQCNAQIHLVCLGETAYKKTLGLWTFDQEVAFIIVVPPIVKMPENANASVEDVSEGDTVKHRLSH